MDSKHTFGIKIFADCAAVVMIEQFGGASAIQGFTTNASLMRKAAVGDYERFARGMLEIADGRPVSFAVTCDDCDGMVTQARKLASWGENVYVKVPATTCSGESCDRVVKQLAGDGIKVNVTALMTLSRVISMVDALAGATAAYVSVLAGRIADTGVDPMPIMSSAADIVAAVPGVELLWGSTRELLNTVQAASIGCDIITLGPELLGKLHLLGRDLDELGLETVQMFYRDAQAAGLDCAPKRTRL